jgi:hypothetical protein
MGENMPLQKQEKGGKKKGNERKEKDTKNSREEVAFLPSKL